MSDWLDDFLAGVLARAGGPCPTCGATRDRRGVIVYRGQQPPLCPTCGQVPYAVIPDNGRSDAIRVVEWPPSSGS